MKTSLHFAILLLLSQPCFAQNLIPNGDFELFTYCPTVTGQIDGAQNWINPNLGSPDYFNACEANEYAGMPANYLGYQNAHSGNAYGGIILFETYNPGPPLPPINFREYLENTFISPLLKGKTYEFRMFVSSADKSNYTTKDLGVYFSDTLIKNKNDYHPLPYTPQITNLTGQLNDTTGWKLISGNYIAKGGEKYILIGNFVDDSSIDTVYNNYSGVFFTHAHIYIDDISLTTNLGIADEQEPKLQIFPNPFTNTIGINVLSEDPMQFILYDLNLHKLVEQTFVHSTNVHTENFSKGIYIYEIRNHEQTISRGKIIRE